MNEATTPTAAEARVAQVDYGELSRFQAKTASEIAELIDVAEGEQVPAVVATLWLLAERLHLGEDVTRRYNDR